MTNQNKNSLNSQSGESKTPPLNQILYGPPGTGKTYSTIDRALEILCNEKFAPAISDRGEILELLAKLKDNPSDKAARQRAKAEFDRFREAGQIEFVTFHQSFSYEEFVEGIKPETTENGEMTYEIRGGIFKEICERALKPLDDAEKTNILKDNIETYFNLAKDMIKHTKLPIVYQDVKFMLTNENKDICVRYTHEDNFNFVIQIGNLRQISDKIKNNGNLDIYNAISEVLKPHTKNDYLSDNTKRYEAFINYMKDTFIPKRKPYILIIDEINRGNISKILGELITLIEPSKRIGASEGERTRGVGDEGMRVSLPYSGREFDGGKGFGVPSNLYIIGTMNTADRSIALLDTALRRRFEFVEMMPEWDNENISTNCDGVNLRELLKAMNECIEFLLDREHTIGHSFFIGVDSLTELRGIFAKKIIPLLQEYFYDDYAKIDAVLNGNKMVESHSMSDLGVKISEDLIDNDKKIYRITKPSEWQLEHFTKIYE